MVMFFSFFYLKVRQGSIDKRNLSPQIEPDIKHVEKDRRVWRHQNMWAFLYCPQETSRRSLQF